MRQLVTITATALVIATGIFIWVKLFRVEPDSPLDGGLAQFRHGVLEAAATPEVPYWIWLVLPRIFPDLLPGAGGYPALGIAWDLGEELPIGFSKRTAGYPRVGTNCAVCHTAIESDGPEENPKFVVVRRPDVSTLARYVGFLRAAANDSRFNADAILGQIDYAFRLSWSEKLLYRYWIIPWTRTTLRDAQSPAGAVHNKDSPQWSSLEMWIRNNAAR
jgi:hypothetical protein